jgi:N-formylglutamate amidohydrolase
MKLPLLLSVPHAGLRVPPEVEALCALTPEQIIADGDEGAAEVYDLESEVVAFVTTDVARAIVDMNRAEDDRRADGVVKTHTCWNVPVYREFPPERTIQALLAAYHRPYHRRLSELATEKVLLGIDCHTMVAQGPPIGPDPGRQRPHVCISDADGTCRAEWIESLKRSFERFFGSQVAVNDPFKGGHLIRSHGRECPWIQLELSRAPFITNSEKRACLMNALLEWCNTQGG